jgi:hypothetical protein
MKGNQMSDRIKELGSTDTPAPDDLDRIKNEYFSPKQQEESIRREFQRMDTEGPALGLSSSEMTQFLLQRSRS